MIGRHVVDPEPEWNSFHVAVPNRGKVSTALAADCARAGLAPVGLDDLLPFGRWFHGDEDPW